MTTKTKTTRPGQRSTANRESDPTRTLLIIAAVVAVAVVIGVIVAVVVGGGDDESAVDPYRPVSVSGEPLPEFTEEVFNGDVPDPAVGQQVPVVSGTDYAGNAVTIDPAQDGPTMIVLLAHWCPHCNAEVPVLNDWRDSGEIPEGLDIVGVSTGASADAPNFPPDEWLVDVDWQWPVLADDANAPAMDAYGGKSYPTLIFVDGDGRVQQRLSGEVPIEVIAPIAEELVDSSTG